MSSCGPRVGYLFTQPGWSAQPYSTNFGVDGVKKKIQRIL